MALKHCKSTNIKGYDYDPVAKTLEVHFHSGSQGTYHGVSQETYDGLESADSKRLLPSQEPNQDRSHMEG